MLHFLYYSRFSLLLSLKLARARWYTEKKTRDKILERERESESRDQFEWYALCPYTMPACIWSREGWKFSLHRLVEWREKSRASTRPRDGSLEMCVCYAPMLKRSNAVSQWIYYMVFLNRVSYTTSFTLACYQCACKTLHADSVHKFRTDENIFL